MKRRTTGRLYSVGYEGLTLRGLIDQLTGSGVTTLVDVRLNPISRKPGFSKRSLSDALQAAGIDYVHERELGNPIDNRDSFRNGDPDARALLRTQYELDDTPIKRVAELAVNGRTAVFCFERDHSSCHRSVVTDMVIEREPSVEVLRIL